MKNLLISSSSAPDSGSGISTYSREISECLSQRGYKIHYLSPTPKDFSWLLKYDIKHLESNHDSNMKSICLSLIKYIKKENIVGIINNDNPALQSIAPAISCPFISIGHLEKFSIAPMATYNIEWIDYVVAISNDMQETYVHRYNAPTSKCPVIYNGINKTIESKLIKPSNKGNKLKLIFAGEYSKRKGADIILSMILTQNPVWKKIELHWYGDLPIKIRNRIKQNKSVYIHGRVPRKELLKELKNSDIFLMASREEGCPMAMLEAMSYGVVPISSNGRGAMRWLIDHGIEGYICHLNNWPKQALECISLLESNRELLNTQKTSVFKKFCREFTVDHTVDKLLSLIQNPTVVNRPAHKPLKLIKWHRFNPKINRASFIDKIFWNLGRLRFCGTIKPE